FSPRGSVIEPTLEGRGSLVSASGDLVQAIQQQHGLARSKRPPKCSIEHCGVGRLKISSRFRAESGQRVAPSAPDVLPVSLERQRAVGNRSKLRAKHSQSGRLAAATAAEQYNPPATAEPQAERGLLRDILIGEPRELDTDIRVALAQRHVRNGGGN